MEFYKEDYLLIEYEEEGAYAVMRWGETPTSEQYREGSEKVLEALEKGDSPTMLIDLQALNIIMSLSDQVWTAKEWLPKVLEEKVTKLAIVIPSSFVTQIAIKSIYGALPQEEVNLGFFDEFEEAESWINEVPESSSATESTDTW
jgi:hypothetical protein